MKIDICIRKTVNRKMRLRMFEKNIQEKKNIDKKKDRKKLVEKTRE